ncbi:MAG: MBL fold metallo-hydrolase [Thermoanaerobaculia bacterium]
MRRSVPTGRKFVGLSLGALVLFFALAYAGRHVPELRTGPIDGSTGLALGVSIGALACARRRGPGSGALALALAALFTSARSAPAEDLSRAELRTEKVADGVFLLTGTGGNIGASIGADGILLVDSGLGQATGRVRAALKRTTDRPIRFVLNTHWHTDHTGGNESLARDGAVVVAHENVRRRMSVEQNLALFGLKFPASPAAALPVVTFTRSLTLHLNGDEIEAVHVPAAHTDGDVIVRFRRSNVVIGGDDFINGSYPVCDLSCGGSVEGMIAAADRLLAAGDERTRYIPGHGPLATRADVAAFREMLGASRKAVLPLVKAGRSLDEVKAARPMAVLDQRWGHGSVYPDLWTTVVYLSLGGRAPEGRPRGGAIR